MRHGLVMGLLVGLLACGSKDEKPKPGGSAPMSDAASATASKPAKVAADAAPKVAKAKPPVVLTSLPEWKMPSTRKPGKSTYQVHAADADASWLFMLTATRKAVYVAKADQTERVTGRSSAGTLDQAREALVAAVPSLATGTKHRRKGREDKVDLLFPTIDAHDLFSLLGDVLRKNIVVAPQQLPRLTAMLTYMPSDAAVQAAASALGLSLKRRGKTWFLLAEGDMKAADDLISLQGPRIDLDVKDATAAQIVELIRLQTKVLMSTDCGGTERTTLSLRDARLGTVLAAIAVSTKATFSKKSAKPCTALRKLEKMDPKRRLVGVTRRGERGAALFRTPEGLASARSGDRINLGVVKVLASGVTFLSDADQKRFIRLRPDGPGDDEPISADAFVKQVAGARLAATIVSKKEQLALVELSDGRIWALRTAPDRLFRYHDGARRWRGLDSERPGEMRAHEAPPVRIHPGSIEIFRHDTTSVPIKPMKPIRLRLRPR